MDKVNAFLQLADSVMEAGMKEIIASPLTGITTQWKVLAVIGTVLSGAFMAGASTVSFVTAQKDYGPRLAAVESVIPEVTETKKMVCEVRAILRGQDPLPCWRGETMLIDGGR
jgi:hypothetical protein